MHTQRIRPVSSERASSKEHEGIIVWDQNGVVVVWPDGHRSRLLWTSLRNACECAECRQQRETTDASKELSL
jgi:DUF971 family protein